MFDYTGMKMFFMIKYILGVKDKRNVHSMLIFGYQNLEITHMYDR